MEGGYASVFTGNTVRKDRAVTGKGISMAAAVRSPDALLNK